MLNFVLDYLQSVMTDPSFFFANFVFLAGMILLLNHPPKTRRDWGVQTLELLGIFAVWFSCWAVLRLFSDSALVGTCSNAIAVLFCAIFFRSYSRPVRLICSMTYLSTYIILGGLRMQIVSLFTDPNVTITGFLVSPAIIAVILFLKRWHIGSVETPPTGYVVLMVTISVLSALLQLYNLSIQYEMSDENHIMLLVNSIFLLVQLMAYYMYYVIGREFAARQELLALQHREELDQDILATAKQTYEALNTVRHEIRNHDDYMKCLLESGDYEGLKRYFDQYQAENAEIIRFIHSGNRQVDAIVNNRITRANLLGVQVETVLAVPEELPFVEKDLCSLISNLLDNGIEACAEIGPEEGDKTLRFQIRQSGNYLFLRTENPVAPGKISPERRLTLKTTKADRSLHGYGTRIIQSIAEKYNGAVKFSQEENLFLVDVMLLLRERQAE
ncbi:MAG: GHKL domain-containing protein [Candidatus Onthomonas sp.]